MPKAACGESGTVGVLRRQRERERVCVCVRDREELHRKEERGLAGNSIVIAIDM